MVMEETIVQVLKLIIPNVRIYIYCSMGTQSPIFAFGLPHDSVSRASHQRSRNEIASRRPACLLIRVASVNHAVVRTGSRPQSPLMSRNHHPNSSSAFDSTIDPTSSLSLGYRINTYLPRTTGSASLLSHPESGGKSNWESSPECQASCTRKRGWSEGRYLLREGGLSIGLGCWAGNITKCQRRGIQARVPAGLDWDIVWIAVANWRVVVNLSTSPLSNSLRSPCGRVRGYQRRRASRKNRYWVLDSEGSKDASWIRARMGDK